MNTKESFSSRFALIATTASAAVGLGNIWRFPGEVAQNGGGVYLLIYLGFSFLIGFPLIVAEMALGRSSGKGLYKAYQGKWHRMAYLCPILCFLILSFYQLVTGWLLAYVWKVLTGSLFLTANHQITFEEVKSNLWGNIGYCLLLSLLMGFISRNKINDGIEKLSKFAMPLLLVLMILLVLYACTLPGAWTGLRFYLVPNFYNLSVRGIVSALFQSFLSLSIGAGISISYGSYIKKEEDLMATGNLIVWSDILIAVLSGFFLFPFLFFQNPEANPSLQGGALTFIQLPGIFIKMGTYTGRFIGFSFYVLLFLAALTSAVAILEVCLQFLQEAFKIPKKKGVFFILGSNFILILAMILAHADYPIFNFTFAKKGLMDWLVILSVETVEPLSILFFCFYVHKYWGIERLIKEIEQSSKMSPSMKDYIRIVITYIAPFLIGVGLLMSLWILIYS